MALRSPLHDRHLAAGARLTEFGGYEMPLQYTGIRDEHGAVRHRAGLFDLSHMGELRLRGPGAVTELSRLVAADVAGLEPGQARYGLICNQQGGIVDDVVVYREPAERDESFLVVVNAACRAKDLAWFQEVTAGRVGVEDESEGTALLAIQGPAAMEAVGRLTSAHLDQLSRFRWLRARLAGVAAAISRTGYTGEDGLEVYLAAADAPGLWDALLEAGRPHGLQPAGLGARDTLRLEAGLRLYGQDMDETIDPYRCGLGWTVRRGGGFVGAEALGRLAADPPVTRFTGLVLEGRALARTGHTVFAGEEAVGRVTSGTFSFSLGRGIATAHLPAGVGERDLCIDIRGARVPTRVARLPFYRRQTQEGDS